VQSDRERTADRLV